MNLEGSPFAKYKIVRTIGSGTYGTVYHVKSVDNKDFVIKSIALESNSSKKQQSSLKEVSVLEAQSHPHLISYLSSCVHEKKLLILMEYAPGGDLQNFIDEKKTKRMYISEKTIWKIIYELCLGVGYLHKRNIIHRDIKCMNILLDKNFRVKIADMGICKISENNELVEGTQVGTPLYLSPEVIQHKPYDSKIDVWAIGCVAYNLAALEPPFQADNLLALARLIVKTRPRPIPSCYSSKLFEFILKLMDKRTSTRPSITEAASLVPLSIKLDYLPPSNFIRFGLDIIDPPPVVSTMPLPKPSKNNSKDKIGSISKYPERFKMYIVENNRLTSSRSLCMKPMPNLLTKNHEANTKTKIPETKFNVSVRPSSGVMRKDLDMNRFSSRPASANSKKTTVRDLLDLDEII